MQWKRARATVILVEIMIAVSILELVTCAVAEDKTTVLVDMGAIVPGMLGELQWLRLISAIFLHAGVFHLVFNLWALAQLGYAWEILFGARKFLFTFFSTGIIASITSALFVKPPGAVGASGAIFGLLAALISLLARSPEWRTAPWVRRLTMQLSIWALITIVIGFFSPRIDNAGHLGGVIGGLAVGAFLPTTRPRYGAVAP